MHVDDFRFELPDERIARRPIEPRDAARLLVHWRAAERSDHRRVADLADLLEPGDLLVVNDTRVLPARVRARRATGGAVELLFLEPVSGGAGNEAWQALVKPARKLRPGEVLEVGAGVRAVAVERLGDSARWAVRLEAPSEPRVPVAGLLERVGSMPLPPYLGRDADDADEERYQTLFASEPGAVAAPTAGLHFTPELLRRLAERGVERTSVTLHVGAGTFAPVTAERLEDHVMHEERFVLSDEAVRAVERCRARGGRVVAVGTTSARVLESAAAEDGTLVAGAGSTRLFIVPGRPFRVVDALLTNFHLPGSTLIMLVAALVGRERVLALYADAIEREYRFYSYGDAMLLLP